MSIGSFTKGGLTAIAKSVVGRGNKCVFEEQLLFQFKLINARAWHDGVSIVLG